MWYIIIIIILAFIGLFIWAVIDYKKQKKELNKKKERPPFRTEDVLQEYGKPLKDDKQPAVDFDDAE